VVTIAVVPRHVAASSVELCTSAVPNSTFERCATRESRSPPYWVVAKGAPALSLGRNDALDVVISYAPRHVRQF